MAGDHLCVAEPGLPDSSIRVRAVVVNVPQTFPTRIAHELGSPSLKAPVVQGLKEGEALVLLLEPKIRLVHLRERQCAFVARVEVRVWGVQILVAQV